MVSDLHMFFAGMAPLVLWDIRGIHKCVLSVVNAPKVRPKTYTAVLNLLLIFFIEVCCKKVQLWKVSFLGPLRNQLLFQFLT